MCSPPRIHGWFVGGLQLLPGGALLQQELCASLHLLFIIGTALLGGTGDLTQAAESVGKVGACSQRRHVGHSKQIGPGTQCHQVVNRGSALQCTGPIPSRRHSTCVVHGLQQLRDQDLVLGLLLLQQAQLLPHVLQVEAVIQAKVLLHDLLGPLWWQLGVQSFGQLHQVPPAYGRLCLIGVAARVVGGVANEFWVKSVETE